MVAQFNVMDAGRKLDSNKCGVRAEKRNLFPVDRGLPPIGVRNRRGQDSRTRGLDRSLKMV